MNLTTDPWIPALQADGTRALFSLQDLFAQARELRDLAVKPHERIALMRLLICITQAALGGPDDEAEWETCQRRIQPAVRDYLTKWKHAFELFGDDPSAPRFLQLPNLKPGKESDEGSAVTKLDLALATGNNSTLFDNSAGEERLLEPARIALNLLTFQCFSPGGRIGVAKWNGKDTPGKGSSNHAPCTPSSMVHALILGATLLDTIHRNLLDKETVSDTYGPDGWGKPVWECPCHSESDKDAVKNATQTYLGRLTPLSRAIRLHEDRKTLILANGLDCRPFPAFREPTATIIQRKDELALLPASASRALWRQLSAISVKRRSNDNAACGPLALTHLSGETDTTLWAGALVTDKAKIEDVVESSYTLPPGMFSPEGRAAYERGVAHAEQQETLLMQAIRAYAGALKSENPGYDRARHLFWTRLEQHLSALFELPRHPALVADLQGTAWGQAAAETARAAYEQTCPRQSPRQIEAYALGLRKLNFLQKTTPEPQP